LEAIHGITITDQPGTVTDPRQYMENGQTQWKCVAARGGGNISEFSGYVDLAKVHGIKPEEYLEEDVYAGNSATSPTENAYLHVWVAPMNATSDIGDQVVYAELQYYCMFKGGKLNCAILIINIVKEKRSARGGKINHQTPRQGREHVFTPRNHVGSQPILLIELTLGLGVVLP